MTWQLNNFLLFWQLHSWLEVYLLIKCKAIQTHLYPVSQKMAILNCTVHCRLIEYFESRVQLAYDCCGFSSLSHCIQPRKQPWPSWAKPRVILPVGVWHFWQEIPLLTVGVGAMADFPDSGVSVEPWSSWFDYLLILIICTNKLFLWHRSSESGSNFPSS